jgi:hypothetical protein
MTPGEGPTGDDWAASPQPRSPWPPPVGTPPPGTTAFPHPGYPGGTADPFGSVGSLIPPGAPHPSQTPGGPAGGYSPVPDSNRGAGFDATPFLTGATGLGPSSGPAGSTIGPSTWMLVAAVIIPVATVPLLFVPGAAINLVGWAVAIFGSLGFLTAFTVVDLRRRVSRWYVDRPGLLAGLRIAAIVAGVVIASCHAYWIADAVARWDRWA